MRPILVFAECSCIQPGTLAIQALFQTDFDGSCVHFTMRCLHCDKECLIKEPFEDYELLPRMELEVMDWLDSNNSDNFLQLALTGRTYSSSKEWKGDQYETPDASPD